MIFKCIKKAPIVEIANGAFFNGLLVIKIIVSTPS